MGPEMKKDGYDENFSAAVNISSATTGLSIPPSNILIVYSLASGGVSITALFLAGYLPGILTGLAIMLTSMAIIIADQKGNKASFMSVVKVLLATTATGLVFYGMYTVKSHSSIAYSTILSYNFV